MDDFGIYVIITKPVLSYEEIAGICVDEKIKMLQLREKHLPDRELLAIGKRIKKITDGTRTNFIINDRTDIACVLEADGYHLGQDDLPVDLIRQKLSTKQNKKMITGLSTHNLTQLKQAIKLNPDYVGFGPIYETPTKANPDPVVGLNLLQQALKVTEAAGIPLVALGGINDENIDEVVQAGAKNVALVRYFMQSAELRSRIRHIKAIINSSREE